MKELLDYVSDHGVPTLEEIQECIKIAQDKYKNVLFELVGCLMFMLVGTVLL